MVRIKIKYKKLSFIMIVVLSLFSFINVNAKVSDISIKSIEQVEKNGNLEERSKVTFNGMNINFDLGFYKVNDSVKYRVTLQNEGEEEIYINSKGVIESSKYITYDYIWSDNDNVIKGKSLKTFDILVSYKRALEESKFKNGRYIEDSNFAIRLSDEKENLLPNTNPKTNSNSFIFIILFFIEMLVGLIVIVYLLKKNKLNLNMIKNMKRINTVGIFIFSILVLITVIQFSYALEVLEVKSNLNVKIYKTKMARSCLSDSYLVEKSGYCIDWNSILPMEDGKGNYVENTKVITVNNKSMEATYMLDGVQYNLESTKDISNLQNGEVILGVYTNSKNRTSKLLIIGETGGVIAPVDASWLFGVYFEKDVVEGKDETDISKYNDVFEIPKSTLNNIRTPQNNLMLTVNSIDLSNLYVGDTFNTSGMFAYNGYVSYDGWNLLGLDSWDTSHVVDTSFMFSNTAALSNRLTIPNINMLDTSEVKNMEAMFMKTAINTSTVSINVSSWNVSNVTDMSRMFNGAFNGIQSFDISNWNVSNVKDMRSIFNDAFKMIVKFDISDWNVSNVENMNSMFKSSFFILQSFDISKWNVSKVIDMSYMFDDSFKNLTKLDLANWDVSKVREALWMFNNAFEYASGMDLNLSEWKVESMNNLSFMFSSVAPNAKSATVDLSKWNPADDVEMNEMFYYAFRNAQKLDLYLDNMDFLRRGVPLRLFNGMPTSEDIKLYLKNDDQVFAINTLQKLGYVPWEWNSNNFVVVSKDD